MAGKMVNINASYITEIACYDLGKADSPYPGLAGSYKILQDATRRTRLVV